MFALAAVLWSSSTLPSFRAGAPAREISSRVVADDRFKSGALSETLASIERASKGAMVQSALAQAAALIRLRTAEEATGSEEADQETVAAAEKVKSSLSLNPADSFLWLMLYSVGNTHNGFDIRNLGYLDQSYASGPFESWIALRRNLLALAIFPMLSEATQQKAVTEFAAMVDSDFIEQAAINLISVGWAQKDRLVASLEQADITSREALAKRLARDGVKVSVPGVEIDERWWR